MAAGPVSIHFVGGETRRPAGNCFATPVLVGRDATAAIVVNEMRETAVTREYRKSVFLCCGNAHWAPLFSEQNLW